jgi:hypothetical protein
LNVFIGESKENSDHDLVINDCFGKLVHRQVIDGATGTVKLDISKFAAGVYFVGVKSNNETQTFKLLKE